MVMGLGLHGGGLESARFLLKRGADVTVTDLRDEKTLSPAIEQLDKFCIESGKKPVRYILGKHDIDDFKNADIVIKNPGVKPDSPFLQAAKKIETDISLFLSQSPSRLSAVTGTKGKSGTASALHWILSASRKNDSRFPVSGNAFLGGNITVSPLSFLDELTENDDVVLELSSFQLGDIKNCGISPLKPKAAILTSIMSDHLDRYASMNEYINDKRNIYRGQDSSCVTIAGDDEWGKSFLSQTKGRPLVCSLNPLGEKTSGGWINPDGRGYARFYGFGGAESKDGEIIELVPENLLTPGFHQRQNMLSAALAAYSLGVSAQAIRSALESFPGIEHRLELFHTIKRKNMTFQFYNDSAATIPEAAAACIQALSQKGTAEAVGCLILVTGGTDKNLDFSPLAKEAGKAAEIILLAGTGSEKLALLLAENNISYNGPFDNLDEAVSCAVKKAENHKSAGGICCTALSPGCASFGMFLNEFDRGRKWKEAVLRMTDNFVY